MCIRDRLRDVQPLAHGDGGQGVFHVEQSGHGQAELPLEPAGAHPEQDVVAPVSYTHLYDSGRVLFLPVEDIAPNPGQPRTQFSQPAVSYTHLEIYRDPV